MRKNKSKVKILIFAMLLFLIAPFLTAFAQEGKESAKKDPTAKGGINVEAKSALLIEPTTGKTVYEKNADEKFAPASVTKVMTMLIAMEHVDSGKIKLDEQITCSENAKKMGGSTMLLDTGEIRTMEELLKGVSIASGNDAAVAIAEYIGGSEEGFVEMMNDRAKELGMDNTHFNNCNGLPSEGHVSTARDIGKMSMELLKHKGILKYSGTYMETITEGRKTPIELVNHNKLVRFFKGCDGLKTGFTSDAKYCISATATRDGVRMLTVIMGAPTYKIRNRDAGMLLNYGFSKFEGKKIVAKDEVIGDANLSDESDEFFEAKAKSDLIAIVQKGDKGQIDKKIVLDSSKDKFKAGEIVGKCELYNGKELVGEVEIYTDRDICKPSFFAKIKYKIKSFVKKDKKTEDKKDSKTEDKKDSKSKDKKDGVKDSQKKKEEIKETPKKKEIKETPKEKEEPKETEKKKDIKQETNKENCNEDSKEKEESNCKDKKEKHEKHKKDKKDKKHKKDKHKDKKESECEECETMKKVS